MRYVSFESNIIHKCELISMIYWLNENSNLGLAECYNYLIIPGCKLETCAKI